MGGTGGRMIWSNNREAQLTDSIIFKTNAGEILDFHRSTGAAWSLSHKVTALHRVAKYPGGRSVSHDYQVS
jgi:hypothetical protein